MVLSNLRQQGYIIAAFIDDMINIEDSINECKLNVRATIFIFTLLGFIIHPIKSVLDPTKRLVLIGSIINSELMIVEITAKKSERVISLCTQT